MRIEPRYFVVVLTAMLLYGCVGGRAPAVSSGQNAEQVGAEAITGDWEGVLTTPGMRLRLVVRVTQVEGGELRGTLDSPDQGTTGIPLSTVAVKDGLVRFGVASIGGDFRGRLSEDGLHLDGTWSQGGTTLPLRLARSGA